MSRCGEMKAMMGRTGLRRVRHAFDVISALVGRDHRGRYKSTLMGMFWSVISPVLFLLTFYFLFKVVLRISTPHFLSYTFVGIIFWNWLSVSLTEGVTSISSNGSLVGQPGFPLATLPVVPITSNFVNLLFSLPFLLLVILLDGVTLHAVLLLLPLIAVVQFVLTLGLLYLISAANVFFRDVQYMLPIFLQLGYFTTPIFYELDRAPQPLRSLLALNPMVTIIDAYRAVLVYGKLPEFGALGIVLTASLALLAIGYLYFSRAAQLFLEEM